MSLPPTQVLSQHVRELLSGRRVMAGVFMTFSLEPQFFEQEIVSLLAGDHLIQQARMRMLQLEEMLRGAIGPLAVYYDPKALKGEGAKQLDIRYVPLRPAGGVFHPKVVLLLTEDEDTDRNSPGSVVCGVLSANLTQSGWWRSVECAHFEMLVRDDVCNFRDELLRFLAEVRRLGGTSDDHVALDCIAGWLRANVRQSRHDTDGGRLRTRLIAGRGSLVDALKQARGAELRGSSLEIVAPFLDESRPRALETLIDELAVGEARVFLPTNEDGSAAVAEELYEDVRRRKACAWGRLPHEMLKLGKDANAKTRGVHAKAYRFFRRSPRYEALVVGSHNLTVAAHGRGGNVEASFLVERELTGSLDWWLATDARKPTHFVIDETNEDLPNDAYVPLQISYDWKTKVAQAMWQGGEVSPGLRVASAGILVLQTDGLPPSEWIALPDSDAKRLEATLVSTAILEVVTEDGDRGPCLVQEYGMSRKPSLVATWTIADVLEYWSRLTPEQRAAFLANHAGNMPEGSAEQVTPAARLTQVESFFTSAAGIFHGFEMLRKQVLASLAEERPKQADYLLFGQRHDSLPNLVAKACSEEGASDPLRSYLVLLSARQLLRELRSRPEPFFAEQRMELREHEKATRFSRELARSLELGPDGPRFLAWFEKHFMRSLRGRRRDADA